MSIPDTLSSLQAADQIGPTGAGPWISCPACGCENWRRASGVRGASLSRCLRCGLLGTTDFISRAKTTDGLYDVDAANLAIYQKQYLPHRLELYARYIPQLEPFRRTGRLLEVGSGYGYFLEMASKAKWDSEGVEVSSYCCLVARERGCKVQQSTLQEAALTPGTFDVITLWDVIEHFSQPDEIISLCHCLLRQGGALLMRTPDGRALASTSQPARTAYRHLVYPANTAEHVFHFTPKDLTAIAKRSGFKVHEIDDDNRWAERVISGNNRWVLAARWLIMRYAQWCAWPYEFVLVAVRD